MSTWNHLISGYHLQENVVAGRVGGGELEDIQGILSAGRWGYGCLRQVLVNKGERQRAQRVLGFVMISFT